MAMAKINPWILGGVGIGGLFVLYLLWQEMQAAQSQASSTASPYGVGVIEPDGTIGSIVPDQISTLAPVYSGVSSLSSSPEPATGSPVPAPVANEASVVQAI